MEKLFFAIGWMCLIIFLLLASLMISVAMSWPTIGGLLLFLGILLLWLVARSTVVILPKMIVSLRHRTLFRCRGRNNLQRLLWRHWWRGGRLQRWHRHLTLWSRQDVRPAWFLVVGLKNSGKQSLLSNSQIMPMLNGYAASSMKSVLTCRWWFFRRAMYLLIAGRYTEGSSLYTQAWGKLTRWMGRVRRPAGVLVCLPMEMLLKGDSKTLCAVARAVRAQIEPLQKRLERRLPVWLMITHSEVMPGFTAWCLQLPTASRGELLGNFINARMDGNVVGALDQSLSSVIDALKMARFKMLNQKRGQPQVEKFELPEQMAALQSSLCCYMSALFDSDHYQQHSMLRGLFFSAQLIPEGKGQPESFFSQRLLEESLPEMAQVNPSMRLPGWRTYLYRGLWTVGVLCGLYVAANALAVTWRGVAQLDGFNHQLPLSRSYLRYQQVETWRLEKWPHLLFYPVTHTIEQRSAREYMHQADVAVFKPTPDTLIKRFLLADNIQKRQLILNWARFVNTENAMAQGVSLATLQTLPVWSAAVLSGKPAKLSDEQHVALRLAAWRLGEAEQDLMQWRDVLQTMLEQSNDWQWLLNDSDIARTHALTLADFWPISAESAASADALIQGQYTQAGSREFSGIMAELAQALARPVWFGTQWEQFSYLYQQQQQAAWLAFAQGMPRGERLVQGSENWRSLILATGQYDSPYMKFLRRMERDLGDVAPENQETWLRTQHQLWQLHRVVQQSSMMQRVSLGNISLRQRILSWLGISPQISVRLDDNALSRYRAWRQALQMSSQRALLGDQEAEQMVKVAFGSQNIASNGDEQSTLFDRFSVWRNETQHKPSEGADNVLWRLWQGDGHLVLRYTFLRTAHRLQSQWERGVIWPIEKLQGDDLIDGRELNARLYEYVNGFVRDTAGFALQILPEGIKRQAMEGVSFPFSDEFILYINGLIEPKGVLSSTESIRRRLLEKRSLLANERELVAAQPQQEQAAWVEARLTSQPATANPGARVLPIGSAITLQCEEGIQQFSSMNFNDSGMLRWSPQTCSRVQVDVRFPTFTLSKSFEGTDGMLKFMRAFSRNELTLAADAFPLQREELQALNINSVTVRYQVSGSREVAELYQQWQNDRQQHMALLKKSNQLDDQLLHLIEPAIVAGSLSNLPTNITSYWNE